MVGSLTHCDGWTGAVVARARGSRFGRGVTTIGLDAEPIAPLPTGVVEVVASVEEREALARLEAERPDIPWDTLLFSAKEATYKAWYPLNGTVIGHEAVSVVLSADGVVHGRGRGGTRHRAAGEPAGARSLAGSALGCSSCWASWPNCSTDVGEDRRLGNGLHPRSTSAGCGGWRRRAVAGRPRAAKGPSSRAVPAPASRARGA